MVINAWLRFILHENGLLQNNPIYGIINILTLNSFVLEPPNVCGRQMLLFHIWNYSFFFFFFLGVGMCIRTSHSNNSHCFSNRKLGQCLNQPGLFKKWANGSSSSVSLGLNSSLDWAGYQSWPYSPQSHLITTMTQRAGRPASQLACLPGPTRSHSGTEQT